MRHRLGLALLLLVTASAALASPAQIVIIRHGEKPDTGSELNERGFARARALSDFFVNDPAVIAYGPPAAIFAMKPKGPDGSIRAIQTVTPLAEKLGLAINSDYLRDSLPELVKAVMSARAYDGKTVLICWEHKVIPQLVVDFGWTTAPDHWAGSVFDRAWILKLSGGRVVSFTDAPEHVLPGDGDR
ncbi:MAG: histidine phosphatase family protein [Elusimicrobia bacterium]|nr:histidine phosphatase family protein [Elusimicrobiota bacterium]